MGPGNVATKCVGTEEYGNQYYEDFDTYCKISNNKTLRKEDGLNSLKRIG